MKQVDFTAISKPKERDGKTGISSGATGSLATTELSQSGALPRRTQHREVSTREPKRNMEAAVSQLQHYGLRLKQEVTGSKFPKGGGWEPIVAVRFSNEDDCDWSGVRSVIDQLMAPAAEDDLMVWLGTLAMETAAKDEGDQANQFRLKVLANRLSGYPGDVVRAVLDEWPLKHTFFPNAFRELHIDLTERMGNRNLIARKLEKAISAKSTRGLDYAPGEQDPDKYMSRNLRIAQQKNAIINRGE